MKKKVLWISGFIPYDKVKHAGGKIHNYYLKQLFKMDEFDLRLLTFAKREDMKYQDLDAYGIENDIIAYDTSFESSVIRRIMDVESTYNPYNRYGRATQNYDIWKLHHYMKKYKKEGYRPDVVLLQWTHMCLHLELVKGYFPDAKYVVIEEDVTYLSYARKMKYYTCPFKRYVSKLSYQKTYFYEVEFFKKADLIILNNHKDEELILKEGIDPNKIFVWAPFFQSFLNVERKEPTHNLIFYGGMARQENYLSAIWFIEKVMPLLSDTDVKIQIVGANPDKSLFKYESDRVEIVGFAEHVEDYLAQGMCLVAPLVLGAGVKIKVIEAMSAGLPVLTNKIGIEGIPAEDKKDFFYCETPEQYAEVIHDILAKKYDLKEISDNSKAFIEDYFNYEKSAKQFAEYLHALVGDTCENH